MEIPEIVAGLRAAFASGRTRPIRWRLEQLAALARMVTEREAEIEAALAADLGKPALEAYTTEIAFTLAEIRLARRGLKRWMKPERAAVPLALKPGKGRIVKEPYGVALIIAPWNYPFGLVTAPLIGALAAGNCVLVKPSEVAPATSALLARLVPEYLDRDCVRVVEGGVPETTALLAERWDTIFYTGNGAVGRIVMAAAARHLTPVTLELGGKSPVIVDDQIDLAVTARRIAWGKFVNAGQTCVAPDYVLAHASIYEALLEALRATVREFYGDDPKASPDFARIVNARHHQRLCQLLGSGQPVCGGEHDEATRYLAPTILRDVPADAPVMAEEIFGPILPVLKVASVEEAIDFVNARDKPLALYVYTRRKRLADEVIARTSSGGVTVNHAFVHLACPALPFGGVGESGLGAYHGRMSFDAFSHRKAVLHKPFAIDPKLVYPPYDEKKRRWVRRLM
jgi:aldehyde dehydrogenase (NAD+)